MVTIKEKYQLLVAMPWWSDPGEIINSRVRAMVRAIAFIANFSAKKVANLRNQITFGTEIPKTNEGRSPVLSFLDGSESDVAECECGSRLGAAKFLWFFTNYMWNFHPA